MIPKGRVLFTVMLVLVFCLTAVFPAAAAPPSAKDLVVKAVHNFDMGMDPGFYDKSEGKGTFEVTRFAGTAKDLAGDYTGAALHYTASMDTAADAMKITYDLDAGKAARSGDLYMQGDKLILSKDFFLLLRDFGVDVFADTDVALDELPGLVYWADPQFTTTWEQMAGYKDGKLPPEFTAWMAFFIEAVPEECFTLSPTKVTMELDQNALVDTVVNLLTKMQNEPEHVVDMVLGFNAATFEQMGLNPEEMKQEMVAAMQAMPLPSRDEVQTAMSVVAVNDFSLAYSLLPGGAKTFNLDLGFAAPDGALDGSFVFAVEAAGTKANLNGNYHMRASFDAADGPNVVATIGGKINYKGPQAYSATTIDVKVQDNATGELMLDLGLADSNVTVVKPDLKLDVPTLTATNSLDVTNILPITASALGATTYQVNTAEDEVAVPEVAVAINGVPVEGAKMGTDGRFVVPARAALEPMGYTVHWVPPNTLRVLGDAAEFTLVMDQKQYTMDNVKAELFAAPCLDNGRAMIPLDFLASEEIGADIGFN